MEKETQVAFLSYVRADDAHEHGKIVAISDRLSAEIRAQTGKAFPIFVDRHDIEWGDNWKMRIEQSLASATLLIPVVTPSYFYSIACREELTKFLERESELGRRDLILPLYYIAAPQLEDPILKDADNLAQELSNRQYMDWRKLRNEDLDSPEVKFNITILASRMHQALKKRATQTVKIDDIVADVRELTRSGATTFNFNADLMARITDPRELVSHLLPGTACLMLRRAGEQNTVFFIERQATTIGRDPSSNIVLGDASVSRRHAEIHREEDSYTILDLGSTNGSRINGAPIKKRELRSGDEIELGMYRFIFVARQSQ